MQNLAVNFDPANQGLRGMKISELESLKGGDVLGGLCIGIGTGSVVYGVGLLTNWWNPVGWVSGAFIAADVACLAYAASKLE